MNLLRFRKLEAAFGALVLKEGIDLTAFLADFALLAREGEVVHDSLLEAAMSLLL